MTGTLVSCTTCHANVEHPQDPRCPDCGRDSLATRGVDAGYRDWGGPWLYGAGLVALAAFSVFGIVMTFADDGQDALAVGVGAAIWAWWFGVFYVYEWTLREDGLLETRALLRRRVETVSSVEHDKDEDFDRWLIRRGGAHVRIHLSAKSGHALANALRARDASTLIHDREPPPPSPLVVQAPRQVP
jgi:hypothetical protein